eukprot:TRINITY_DN1535_c1_g1_i2.p1 TRINITY_DN1535_c1_g1~~TRINITY_DN1535_c1_g1_i2.p1  ORF type:complete len:199 (+),score=39.30 TRINITY_DN1535_c1_g1_i2:68-598(+)
MNKVVMLVLGKRLNRDGSPTEMLMIRMTTAVELYNRLAAEKKDVWVIVSGGQVEKGTGNKNPTEAEVMKKLMTDAGVPAFKIIQEQKSRTTVHNMENSRPLLSRGRYSEVYLLTTDFHLPRSLVVFKNLIPAFASKVTGVSSVSGLDEEKHAAEVAVEVEMLARYKTRFPTWNFDQ